MTADTTTLRRRFSVRGRVKRPHVHVPAGTRTIVSPLQLASPRGRVIYGSCCRPR